MEKGGSPLPFRDPLVGSSLPAWPLRNRDEGGTRGRLGHRLFLHRSAPRQEIDVEISGNKPCRMLLNVYFNPGNKGTELDYGYRGSPSVVDLDFDASAGFHRYAIEWFPDLIRWFVDDVLGRRGSWESTPVPHLPRTLHANLWPPRSVELAGAMGVRLPFTTASFRNVTVDAVIRTSGDPRLD
ncbi:family 16 glycosylhydrolase [Amorphus sp. MBR-141]